FAEFFVDLRRGLFEDPECPNHLARHAVVADFEMVQRPFGLRAPITIGGHLDGAHRVCFGSSFGVFFRGILRHCRVNNIIPVPDPPYPRIKTMKSLYLVLLLTINCFVVWAQEPSQQPEVVRTNTELVQTAVTVLDKKGNFVDGLQRDQFQLIVDGQPRPVAFFERVASGSPRELEIAALNNADTKAAK